MDIRITADPACSGDETRLRLEDVLHGALASCQSQVRQVVVSLEALDVSGGLSGWECRLYARLTNPGAKAVFGDGKDPIAALRGAAELLARTLQGTS